VSRLAGALVALCVAASASAQPAPAEPPLFDPPASAAPAPVAVSRPAPAESSAPASNDDVGDQAVSVQAGLATGGRVTPGGLRIAGHYLYQLSERDFFDGSAAFTFGSGSPACFRDRDDKTICDHGLADGAGVEISARIRRMFAPSGAFYPFAQLGVGIGFARFSDDDVSGLTVPFHGGGGIRYSATRFIAIVAEGDLALGFGSFGRGLGTQPQVSLTVTAGAEFRLR
jgi:hypothetical protein